MRSVRISVLILLAGLFLFCDALTSRAAPLSDGSFENLPFATATTNGVDGSAWTVHDDSVGSSPYRSEANVVGAVQGIGPLEGTRQALITTGTGNDSGSALPSTVTVPELVDSINAEITDPGFIALDENDLEALVSGIPGAGETWEGAAISQRFEGTVGENLTFKWDFLTSENPGSPAAEDFAFLYLTSSEGLVDLRELARSSDATSSPAAGPFVGHTTTMSETILLPGTTPGDFLEYYLVIGVIDQNSVERDSGILVDDFFAPGPQGNPEPASGVLMLLGMIGLALRRRNRRR